MNNYIFGVVLSSAINGDLVNATEKGLIKTIMLQTVIQCIIPYLTMQDSFNTGFGNSIVWFGYIYMLAFYIRKYNVP